MNLTRVLYMNRFWPRFLVKVDNNHRGAVPYCTAVHCSGLGLTIFNCDGFVTTLNKQSRSELRTVVYHRFIKQLCTIYKGYVNIHRFVVKCL